MEDVLITRPEPGAAKTAAALRTRGFNPITAPVLHIVPVGAELPPAAGLQAVLVTSAQALPALGAHRGLPLLAVGAATAAAAIRIGHADVASADGDANALAQFVLARCSPSAGTLLLVSGEGQGEPLAKALQAGGFHVAHHAVYAARPVAALPASGRLALLSGTLYAATFFSADTARAFAALADRAGLRDTVAPVVAVAIAGAAAEALAVLPWRCVRVAARPTQDELLALL
jgi:uroporphyrinogen-III synthase